MRRPAALLAFLLALPALQGCATARPGIDLATLGGAPAESAWLAEAGRYSSVELRRPAHVALVEFDTAGARVLSMTDGPLRRGQHSLPTPGVVRLANQHAGPCDRRGETMAPRMARSPGSAARTPIRIPRQKYRMHGQVYCARRIPRHGEETHRHLLLVASDVPFAPGLAARVRDAGQAFAALESREPAALASRLTRAVAPGDEETWTARVYLVVAAAR